MYRYLTLILLISIVYGCDSASKTAPEPVKADEDRIFQGTIGSICELVGYQAVKVQGYSLVIGLAGTGSSGCPAPVKNYLGQDLRRLKDQGFLPPAYMDLSIDKLIEHSSTAVVRVSGMVPAGSLKGDRFDVEVTALEGTQTTSLQGGRLVRSQLQIVVPGSRGRPVASRPTALARGPIFINPFSVRQGEVRKVDPRRGMVLGGGRATYDSQIRLSLLRPDYRQAQLIQNRVNSRFQGADDDKKIAEATGRGSIILRAPKAYRERYSQFISLVWGLYLQGSPGYLERKLLELLDLAGDPDADLEAISLAWEGIGKPALPKLYPIYQDVLSGKTAYFAARTALNLEDRKAIDAMIKMALDDSHPYQMSAAKSLSEYPKDLHGRAALVQLLKKDNYRLRLLAYEGLRKGEDIVIRSSRMGEGFTIDEVSGAGDPIVAVWATKDPRIVIFGDQLKCRNNLFYSSEDEKVTLNARPGDADIGITLTIPKDMGYVSRKSRFEVVNLIKELSRPVENKEGKVIGPGLCFSEIVGILYALCEDDMIPARFTLHRITEDLTRESGTM